MTLTPEEHVTALGATLKRLEAFASTFNPGDNVDQSSGLKADDLLLTVELLQPVHTIDVRAPASDLS